MDYAELAAKDKQRLQRAVEGRQSSQGYVLGTKKDYSKLGELGMVELNDQIGDGKGSFAVRASDAGLAVWTAANGGGGQATGSPAGAVAQTATTEKPKIKVTKAIPIPQIKRVNVAGESQYPFDTLEIGDSFHLPKTDDMPDPAKSLASSVSSAKRRFSERLPGEHKTRAGMMPNYKLTRDFIVRSVDKSDPDGEGARVWRVDLPADPIVDGRKRGRNPGNTAGASAAPTA